MCNQCPALARSSSDSGFSSRCLFQLRFLCSSALFVCSVRLSSLNLFISFHVYDGEFSLTVIDITG